MKHDENPLDGIYRILRNHEKRLLWIERGLTMMLGAYALVRELLHSGVLPGFKP
jgi:hypothetical protein